MARGRFAFLQRIMAGTDWVLVLSVVTLAAFGLAAMYSIDVGTGTTHEARTQVVALLLGLGCALFMAQVPTSAWRSYSLIFFVLGLGTLIYVLFFGTTIRGTRGWVHVGGLSFQPVEFMKVALVVFMAYLVERLGRSFQSFFFFSKTALYALVPIVLVLLQPDLGSSIVLFSIWFTLMLIVGIRRQYVLIMTVLLLAVALFSWFFVLAPYQKDRIRTFVDPNRDPLGAGYNVQQSMIAIGSGRVFGRGLGSGSQTQLRFLPEGQTDFIFAVIAEELGFAGVSVVFIALFMLWYRLLRIAMRTRDDFSLFVVLGALSLIFTEVFINMGATLGILPVTGIALPFVSAGGSSLLMHFVLLGVVLSIAADERASGARLH